MAALYDGESGDMRSSVHHCDPETPLAAIRRLAAGAASGELIVATDAVEIHVYFLEGRLAWATTSTSRHAFVQRLVDHHGIARDTIRDVIDECQRSRRRLGETLISWGIATAEQVRDALASQIAEALDAAAAHPAAQTLFLPRRMAYAIELTFALDELVARTPVSDLDELSETIVATVLDSIPETLWVEVTAGDRCLARAVRGTARPTDEVATLRRALDEDVVDALILRTNAGVILGQRVPGRPAAVWCAAGPGVKLGVASAVLVGAVGAMAPPPAVTPVEQATRERNLPSSPCAPGVLASALRTTDDLVAGLVLDRDGQASGAWRGEGDLDDHTAVARALLPALRVQLRAAFARTEGDLGYEQVSVRGQTARLAYHGALLRDGSGSIWLAVRPGASQGLGWALLQTVVRQCADAAGAAP